MKSLIVCKLSVIAVCGVLLSGCATEVRPSMGVAFENNVYPNPNVRYGHVQEVSLVRMAPVVREFPPAQSTGRHARSARALLSGLPPGAFNNHIEDKDLGEIPGWSMTVKRQDDGEILRFVQPDQGRDFQVGMKVKLVKDHGQWTAVSSR